MVVRITSEYKNITNRTNLPYSRDIYLMFALCSPGCCAGAGTILEVDDVDDGVVEPLVPGLQAAVAGPVLQLKTKVHTEIRNHGECPLTTIYKAGAAELQRFW